VDKNMQKDCNKQTQNPIKDQWVEPSYGDKKGKPKKGQKMHSP
jgi:hypothetical protein